jgi:predicted CoA-substrate-specific enzyme activase
LSSSVNGQSPLDPIPQGVIGLDIGSSYVKAVSLNPDNTPAERYVEKTGYNYTSTVTSLLARFKNKPSFVGVTGYGRHRWEGVVHKTEISALAMGMKHLGFKTGTLVDIGGQDSKVLKLKNGELVDHALNKRCAAGTGSYLEFIAYRMNMDILEMNRTALREKETGIHPLNSFCTVFAGTEILDCIKKNIPLPKLIRGLYASIAQRVREISGLEAPVFLSGGVIAHHPALLDVFNEVLELEIQVIPHPQFLAALGIAVYANQA